LDNLLARHIHALSDAISTEQGLIEKFAPAVANTNAATAGGVPASDGFHLAKLSADAEENKNYCIALLASNDKEQRTASEIFADLSHAVARLQAIVAGLSEVLRPETGGVPNGTQ
jgi:hypothetical protein